MKTKIPLKDLNKIRKIIESRHSKVFEKKMTAKQKNELNKRLVTAFKEDRLVYDIAQNKSLRYFFIHQCAIMHEFQEEFLVFTNCYCANETSSRKKFFGKIKEISSEFKKKKKIKRIVVEIGAEDLHLKKTLSKKGILTYVELVGNTKKGLMALKDVTSNNISVKRVDKKDLSKLAALDLESHLSDKTSRMHDIFKRPDGKKIMKGFYNHIYKKRSCFVAKEDKKIAGSVCYFIDTKNKYGLIASIFVSNEYKGQGISKVLYKKLLDEFLKKNLNYYIGSSTTKRVLQLTEKMKRKESSSSYIVKI
jgi:predicted GNAT family acetyltransferase